MIKKLLAFLTALVLLPVSLSAAEEEDETETFTGPVAKTVDELNAMLGSSQSVTGMIDTPFYENVTDEDTALEAMGSVMDRLGCDDTTKLVLDSVRSTEDGMTYYTFRQKAGDLAVYGGAAKLIVDKNGTAAAAVATIFPNIPDTENAVWCEVPDSLQEYSDMLTLTFLYPDWKTVESTWPDARLKGFLYIMQAGEYLVVLTAPGEGETEPASWLMAGDKWVCMNGENPVPDTILFTYEENCVYELPTDGLV